MNATSGPDFLSCSQAWVNTEVFTWHCKAYTDGTRRDSLTSQLRCHYWKGEGIQSRISKGTLKVGVMGGVSLSGSLAKAIQGLRFKISPLTQKWTGVTWWPVDWVCILIGLHKVCKEVLWCWIVASSLCWTEDREKCVSKFVAPDTSFFWHYPVLPCGSCRRRRKIPHPCYKYIRCTNQGVRSSNRYCHFNNIIKVNHNWWDMPVNVPFRSHTWQRQHWI